LSKKARHCRAFLLNYRSGFRRSDSYLGSPRCANHRSICAAGMGLAIK
jgi:hypothetical protein